MSKSHVIESKLFSKSILAAILAVGIFNTAFAANSKQIALYVCTPPGDRTGLTTVDLDLEKRANDYAVTVNYKNRLGNGAYWYCVYRSDRDFKFYDDREGGHCDYRQTTDIHMRAQSVELSPDLLSGRNQGALKLTGGTGAGSYQCIKD